MLAFSLGLDKRISASLITGFPPIIYFRQLFISTENYPSHAEKLPQSLLWIKRAAEQTRTANRSWNNYRIEALWERKPTNTCNRSMG
jgi:hypothetical protein